jgi:polysaccharide biosynthesis protein PslH
VRILWLKTELLHPVDKGGKIRSYNMLKEMKREHHITYLTLDDGSASSDARERADEYCHELVCIPHRLREKFSIGFYVELLLNLTSSLPYAIKKYESAAMRREIASRQDSNSFDVLVCDFLAPAPNVPLTSHIPTILFQHNVEAMIWKRHYETQTRAIQKLYLHGQWRKMQKFEREMCRRFDTVIAVSAEDRDQIRAEYGAQSVFDVPTGVDTDFFRPGGTESPVPNSLVFTGSMDWLPNQDAILYFAREIMPLIKQRIADVTLTIVGRNPSASLLECAKYDPSLIITGRVDDVRPYIERSAAYIVPLRIGGGTRLKIFEALAMEKPVISTSVGAEGLPITNGVDLLLADEPVQFADAVTRVLTNTAIAADLGRSGSRTVRQNYEWRQVAERFLSICTNMRPATEPATAGRLTSPTTVL